jgi:long-chain acyl-CoA synthetase
MGEVAPTVMISVPRLFERIYNLIAKSVEEGPASKRKIFNWAIATGKARAQVIAQEKTPGALLNLKYRLAHKLVFEKLHQRLGGRLRFAVSGGAALPKAIGEFFQAAGITIIEGYGLTETAPVLTINPMHAPRYGQVGHVNAGVTVGIMDIESGQIKGMLSGAEYPSSLTTEPGEIVAKGPNIMKGYWNNDSATAESIDAEGWYHTGDVGRFVDGYLQITDRIKHMIVNKGGKNIYPGPIEELFKTTPGIDQVMVIGEGREFLTALVVPDTDFLRALAGADESVARADLLTNEAVLANFRKVFKDYSRTAASHEKIRDCRLVDEAFSVDNGQMTPTLKLRRRQIEEAYADLIETMYESVV